MYNTLRPPPGRALACALMLTLTACTRLPVPDSAPQTATSPATTPAPAPTPDGEPAPAPRPGQPPKPEPAIIVASSEAQVQAQLRGATAVEAAPLAPDMVGYYLDVHYASLQTLASHGVRVARLPDHLRLVIPGGEAFDNGSAALTPASQKVLDMLAEGLGEYDKTLITVAGYGAGENAPEDNPQLSEQRARAVGEFLRRRGVSPLRLVLRNYGDSRPTADGAGAEGRAANHRIELELWPLIENASQVSASGV